MAEAQKVKKKPGKVKERSKTKSSEKALKSEEERETPDVLVLPYSHTNIVSNILNPAEENNAAIAVLSSVAEEENRLLSGQSHNAEEQKSDLSPMHDAAFRISGGDTTDARSVEQFRAHIKDAVEVSVIRPTSDLTTDHIPVTCLEDGAVLSTGTVDVISVASDYGLSLNDNTLAADVSFAVNLNSTASDCHLALNDNLDTDHGDNLPAFCLGSILTASFMNASQDIDVVRACAGIDCQVVGDNQTIPKACYSGVVTTEVAGVQPKISNINCQTVPKVLHNVGTADSQTVPKSAEGDSQPLADSHAASHGVAERGATASTESRSRSSDASVRTREATVHPKLYPTLSSEEQQSRTTLKPLTEAQLRSLYYNHELEHSEEYIDTFLQQAQQEGHEFHEIVMSYYRARHNLANSEHAIAILQNDTKRCQDLAWETIVKKVTIQAVCLDKCKVTQEVTYDIAEFRPDLRRDLEEDLGKIRAEIHEKLSLYGYEARVSRLQVESYIYWLYARNPALNSVPHNAPIQVWLAHQRDATVTQQVELLRRCISVLFMFQRKPIKDDVFAKDAKIWLSNMVATMLRLATLEDHLFIFNHILRCPAGVTKWAAGFVQVISPLSNVDQLSWSSPLLDHNVTMLAMLLQAVRQREEMLSLLKVTLTPSGDKVDGNPWILVDSDGEEDEDPNNSWLYFQENDIVTLLNQFSPDMIFAYVLLITEQNGRLVYDVTRTSESGMSKLFAFVSCLIRLLGRGLLHYSLGRYRQVNKRIGRIARHIVQYTCDHWTCFKAHYAPQLPAATMERLQIELDMVLQRAVICILSAHRLGAWQFLTELPYEAASRSMLWTLLWLMHQGCCQLNLKHLEMQLGVERCKQSLSDNNNKIDFFDKLTSLPASEVIFLLTTFANMARLRDDNESDFIEEASGEIFEIAYVNGHTREFCSKPGRELLRSVCSKHPFIVSFLLKSTAEKLDKIGLVSHFLFRGLPLKVWRPTTDDLCVMRRWLLDCDMKSIENQLARLIIDNMNWSLTADGETLFLDYLLHRQMAVLLMDTYSAHLSGKPIGQLFTDVPKQPPTPSGKSTASEENQLAQWTWSVALRLKLHARAQSRHSQSTSSCDNVVVDLTTNESVGSIVRGLLAEQRFSLACFLALNMTKCGHSVSEFFSEGVQHLCHLVEKSLFVPFVHCLDYITPMFFTQPSYLTANNTFMQALQTTLTSDSAKRSYFSYEVSRTIVHTFSSMIEFQVQEADTEESGICARDVVNFWLTLLTKLGAWSKEKDILCVIDAVIKSSFARPGLFDFVQKFLMDLIQTCPRETGAGGIFSSLTSWFVGSKSMTSLIDQQTCADVTWVAYVIGCAEFHWLEMSNGLWLELQKELFRNVSLTVDQALNRAVSTLKVDSAPASASLSIYRWANHCVETAVGHPLLPLLLQRFMLLYLARPVIEPGLPQRDSVGERFFAAAYYRSLMKRMKKHLGETADHYQTLSASNEFYQKLVKFYQTLSFWLDEPRLHDSNLYLPSLPAQYQANLLAQVLQNQTEPWMQFVDVESINSDLSALRRDWLALRDPLSSDTRADLTIHSKQPDALMTAERIVERILGNKQKPVEPPSVVVLKSPVPDIDPCLFSNQQRLLFALHSDFVTLVEYSKLYGIRQSRHVDLDCSFLELLPTLYKNVLTETRVVMPCYRTFNPTHQCKGPAIVNYRHDHEKRDEIVSRRIDENRATYKQLIIECLLPPPQNVCTAVVHVENAITALINLSKTTTSPAIARTIRDVGASLFYAVTTYISDETKYYLPTRQFFACCIEVLGQEFIRNNPSQSQPLLQAILQTPSLAGLLAPNFSPNSSPEFFVAMYGDLLPVPSNQGVDVTYMLLTKFDMPQWLEVYKPSLSQRNAVVELISSALCMCGREPQSSARVVFEIYRVHLQQLVAHQFPDLYGSVLKLLLNGSAVGQLNATVWADFLDCLGAQQLDSFTSASQGLATDPDARRPSVMNISALSYSQMKESVDFLSAYFFRLRLTVDGQSINFGLYPNWKTYSPYIARISSYLAHNLILVRSKAVSTGGFDVESVVYELFKLLVDLFSPWVQPLNNDGQLLLPCVLNDVSIYTEMVSTWLDTVECLQCCFQDCLPACSCHALNLLWTHYVNKLAMNGVPDHILIVYHTRLLRLPWKVFFPDMEAVELMMKMIEYPKICFEFLGNLLPLLNWSLIIHFYCSRELPELVSRLHVCLFTIFVRLAKNPSGVENARLCQLISSDHIFHWDALDGKSYFAEVEQFWKSCDPLCVIAERSSSSAQVLNLLKIAAGFNTSAAMLHHPETPVKRSTYVRCIIQLVCRCSYATVVKTEALGIVINNLLTEIETVVGQIDDAADQRTECMSLCTEAISVLNNCSSKGDTTDALLLVLQQWIESSTLSLLLQPLMISACRSLASLVHMVNVLEACIDAHFSLDVTQTENFGWTRLLGVIQIPDLNQNEFLNAAVDQGSYLTLYAYILQQLPMSQCLADELKHLNQLITWNNRAKPSSNETKLFLWWHKIIELSIRQVDFGGDPRLVVKALLSFISTLMTFCEDKSGLLAIFGLGKKSVLSTRFRLVAKGLVSFISSQMPSDLSLRMQPDAPGSIRIPTSPSPSSPVSPPTIQPSLQAIQTLAHLESLRTNKQYSMFRQQVDLAIRLITNEQLSFRDTNIVLSKFVSPLFPEVHHLGVVRYESTGAATNL